MPYSWLTQVQTHASHDSSDPFYLNTAPYAYPSPFPPCCDYPSIHTPSPVHLETQWLRQPNTERKPVALSSLDNVDNLASTLAGLVLDDTMEDPRPSSNATKSRTKCKALRTTPGCYPVAVYPSPAPLAALIPDPDDVRRARKVIPSKAPKPIFSGESHALPYARGQQSTRARSSLSLRVPKSVPKLVREYTHPYTNRPKSRSKVKRLSSSSSLSSISSADSSSSSIDSPLPTPPSSPRGITSQTKLPSVNLIFGSDVHELGGPQIPRVSLEEGLQMNWDTY